MGQNHEIHKAQSLETAEKQHENKADVIEKQPSLIFGQLKASPIITTRE